MIQPDRRVALAIALCCWLGAARVAGESFTGKCLSVGDGDTITVSRDGEPVRVRLEGIDAPERGREFSRKARRHLASFVLKQPVTVRVKELDRYGRTVGRVFVHGRDTSLEMVEAGLAWHFTRYSDDPALAAAERAARAAGVNLWSLPDPTPPWVERARDRDSEARAPPTDGETTYHGNRRSRVFHGPWCEHYDCRNCTVVFASRKEAIDAGYRPGGRCKP